MSSSPSNTSSADRSPKSPTPSKSPPTPASPSPWSTAPKPASRTTPTSSTSSSSTQTPSPSSAATYLSPATLTQVEADVQQPEDALTDALALLRPEDRSPVQKWRMGQVVDGGANLQGVLLRNLKNYPIAVSWSCGSGAENAAVAQEESPSPVSVCVLPQGSEPLWVVEMEGDWHVEGDWAGRGR